jgi:tRNA splicing ligase
MLQIGQHHGVVIADRNNLTIKQFSELQDHCFTLKITLIPVGDVSELPQLLVQMVCNILVYILDPLLHIYVNMGMFP